jgi:hypothetical protein
MFSPVYFPKMNHENETFAFSILNSPRRVRAAGFTVEMAAMSGYNPPGLRRKSL